jgi:hypothetical protein
MFDKWFLGSINIGKIDVHWSIVYRIRAISLVVQLIPTFEDVSISASKLVTKLREVFSNNNYEREERSTK